MQCSAERTTVFSRKHETPLLSFLQFSQLTHMYRFSQSREIRIGEYSTRIMRVMRIECVVCDSEEWRVAGPE